MTSLYWGVQLNMQGGFVSRHSFSRSASRLQTGGRKGGFVTTLAVVNGVARRGCRRWGCRQRDAEDPPQLARGDRWCVTEGSRPLDRPGVGAGGGRFTGRRRAGGASQTATCPPRTRERISRPLMALGARGRPLHHPNRWPLIQRVRSQRHAQLPVQYCNGNGWLSARSDRRGWWRLRVAAAPGV